MAARGNAEDDEHLDKPFQSIISLTFPTQRHAEYSKRTLDVDEELQPDKIDKMLTLDNTTLIVTFRATEIRWLRAAVASFYDMSLVVCKTILEFDDELPHTHTHVDPDQ